MFADRREAGRTLASLLLTEREPLVLGIARGGVIVAHSVALALGADLDVVVIRKVGHPRQRELALGAVSAAGESVIAPYASEYYRGPVEPLFEQQVQRARDLELRVRGDSPPISIEGRNVIIVDDGIATSATMECAVAHARHANAARVVCAAPVAPSESIDLIRRRCDEVAVIIVAHERDFAVGRYYRDFREVDDRQVIEALQSSVGRG
ncbi:MAG TPA: phosphoribosyltransferase family protein [Candidatus Eremiobacteraceae bacterium]|nr:phosphoribosyltransferase family protein [Candidatus Eremiobacteraceae bacterium]